MSRRDVPEDDMTPHEFSDDDAEAIISGYAPRDPELGPALDDLRSAFAAVEPPTASGALSEFIVRGSEAAPVPAGAAAVPVVEPLVDDIPTRRHPVLASLSAFAGTAVGKLCIGASVATAAVGGATVAGVDTPVTNLFEDDAAVVTEVDPDESIDETADDDSPSEDHADDSIDDSSGDDPGPDDDNSPSDDESSDDIDDDADADESSDDTDDGADDSPDDGATAQTAPGTASVTHVVDGVGTVSFTYDGGAWALDPPVAISGWTVDEAYIDDDGPDVTFVNGPIEVDVDAEIEDGRIRVRVRTDDDDTDARTEAFFWYDLDGSTASGSADPTTTTPSTTAPTTTAPTATTPSTTTSTTVPVGSSASVTHTVPGVGTVSFTYDRGAWMLGAVTPAGGYLVDEAYLDADGPDVTFVNGPIEVDVDAEIEDGQIRVRVRTDNDDTDERTEAFFWYPLS